MVRTAAAALLLAAAAPAPAAEDGERTFVGTWVNKRYNTTGTLRCVAKPGDDGAWAATFSGTFQGEKFSYDVTFDGKSGKGQTDLSGKADLRNHKYEWAGVLKGDTLTGRYRSNSGYFGDFVLKERKK